MTAALYVIDWSAPWLTDIAPVGLACQQWVLQGHSVAQALNRACQSGSQFEFVAQAALPIGMAYESFIHDQRSIPTRDNWHDFFNGLIWLHYPQVKRQLNQLHQQAIEAAARMGGKQQRGPLRDATTVLDENGALLYAPDALWRALQARQWHRLFVELRPLWQQARLYVFGHALLEKILQPRKAITAHVLHLPVPKQQKDCLPDAWLAEQLTAEFLSRKPFCPLPVLGIPGWWPANQDSDFYDDSQVFRP